MKKLLLVLCLFPLLMGVGPLEVDKGGLAANFPKVVSVHVDLDDAGNSLVSFNTNGVDWVDDVIRTAEGNWKVVAKSTFVTRTPHCVGSSDANHEPGGAKIVYRYTATSGDLPNISLNIVEDTGTNVDEDFVLVCTL